jgi:hypothetical protein
VSKQDYTPTLADHILSVSMDKGYDNFSRNMNAAVAKEILVAQRFIMSEEVRDACRQLLTSRPSSLLDAMQWCRPPFENMWLEWPTPNQPDPIAAVRVKTTRVGALLKSVPGSKGRAFNFYTAWTYNETKSAEDWYQLTGDPDIKKRVDEFKYKVSNIGVSSMEVGIELDAIDGHPVWFPRWQRPPAKILTPEYLRSIRNDEHNGVQYALKSETERLAMNKVERAVSWRLRQDKWAQEMMAVSQAFGQQGLEAAMDDVKDEIGPVIAMLILMNARNCVEIEKSPDLSRLNKARRKRGKSEYMAHSIVHIRFSKGMGRVGDARGMTAEERKRHIVRGHFKTRKTGVYWWSSFVRGSAAKGYVQHDAYVMDHPPR